jgi:DNA-binding response OmpR family regulator
MGNLAIPFGVGKTLSPVPATKPSGRILVVEDDPAVQKALRRLFETEGYVVETQSDGKSAVDSFHAAPPSAVVLDLRLPRLSGRDVCKEIKAISPTLPIVVLSAASDVSDKVLLLELGADDYVTKPFSPREIVLRIRAILRRAETANESLTAGPISIDPARHEVRVDGKQVHLTSLEFKLLRVLMQRRGRVQERDRLLNEVWGYESVIDTRTVDTHVRRLREKLGKAGDAVETVRGFGYRLRES